MDMLLKAEAASLAKSISTLDSDVHVQSCK